MKKETMIIGKIMGAHGIRGELKVYPLTDDPGRFHELDEVTVTSEKSTAVYPVELVRLHKGKVLLTLSGISDRTQSEKLIGRLIEIDRDAAVALGEDEYFIEDMIGLLVYTPEDQPVGKVKNIIQTTGGVDTVEIETAEKMIYVPARKVYFLRVDTEGKKIVADIPEDLMAL